jgi:protease-4
MKFIKTLIAVILGIFISLFLIFGFFAVLGTAFSDKEKTAIKEKSVLVLNMDGDLPDYRPTSSNPFEEIIAKESGKFSFTKLLNAIENARDDERIKGISLEFPLLTLGIAQAQELRDALSAFKSSGKFIMAYSDLYTQKNYYISSVADSIFLQPEGFIDLRGLTAEKLYFKDFQDKYGIRFEVIRHGKYKSAMEGFLSNEMSDANREQTSSFLHSIWDEVADDIAHSRNMSIERFNNIVDNNTPRVAQDAIESHLIDGTLYADEYSGILASLTEQEDGEKPNKINIADYIGNGKGRKKTGSSKDKIAILFAQGEIKYGRGDESYIGNEAMINALKKIRKDKNIKAVVLRINSPGGSALASELIWRELELTKKEKPIVVSMGNLAASGGYYIACNANKIIAEPTTITGSIGVFGALLNIHDFAQDKGINAEQVYTNKAPHYSIFEPMNPEFHEFIKFSIDKIYHTFVSHVAQGRNMSFSEVDSIAQGRVWTGKEALKIGLVDELGSLDDALKAAAQLAELDSYKIRNYPRYKKDFKEIFSKLPFGKIREDHIIEEIGAENYALYKQLKTWKDMQGIQARLPYQLNIK